MSKHYNNGWLAEQEQADKESLFGSPCDGLHVVDTDEAMALIAESAKTPILTHPWKMASFLHEKDEAPYRRLTVWNQDANNCAGHATSRAIESFMLIAQWTATRRELKPFEVYVPWVWGVGKNEVGQSGTGGATMGAMLSMIAKNGVLPADLQGLPPYNGTSNAWAKNYGKQSQNAPYSQYWPDAKQHVVTVAELPRDADAFYLACKGGFAVAFGTSQRIVMQGTGEDRVWKASGGWMHAMAAYGYNERLESVGIDNSHGDGFAWASESVLKSVVESARFYDAFAILGIQPRQSGADWTVLGRN